MATKNNLDAGTDDVAHKDLATHFAIGGEVYSLASVIVAVQGDQSADDWNKRTLKDRLDAIKQYLADVQATDADAPAENGVDGKGADGGNGTSEGDVAAKQAAIDAAGDDEVVQLRSENAALKDRIAEMEKLVERYAPAGEASKAKAKKVEPAEDEVNYTGPTLHGSIQDLKRPY